MLPQSHRPFQRIAHQGALVHYGVTFQVAIAGERHRRLRGLKSRIVLLAGDVHFFFSCLRYSLRLIAECLGHLRDGA